MMLSHKEPWVFWDMDGTLIDSVPILYQVYKDFLKEHGKVSSAREFERLNGPALHEVVAILKDRHQLAGSREQLMSQYKKRIHTAYKAQARLRRGVVDALSAFRKAGFRQMVVSSSSTALAVPCLTRNKIVSFFEYMVFGDQVKRSKPSPDIYRKALAVAKTRPSHVVVIEDSKNGLLAARRAGLEAMHVGESASQLEMLTKEIINRRVSQFSSWPLDSSKSVRVRCVGEIPGKDHIFCVDSVRFEAAGPLIRGRFIPYAQYRLQSHRYAVLAVSGLVSSGQGGEKKYLWGVRSQKVFHYKKAWELVPSGGVDPSCARPGGKLDLRKMLLSELLEEAGIRSSQLKSVKPLRLIWDPKARVWDVCLSIQLKNSMDDAMLSSNPDEHSQMGFYSENLTERKILKAGARIVPTSAILWNTVQNKKGDL